MFPPPIPTQKISFEFLVSFLAISLFFPPSTISEKKEEITVGPTTAHKAQWSVAGRAAVGSSSVLASHRSWCVPRRRAISIQMREQ